MDPDSRKAAKYAKEENKESSLCGLGSAQG
jgi:hypothetical protein